MKNRKKNMAEDLPKENPFKTPDGYFEEFDKRILERIEKEEKFMPGKGGKLKRLALNQLALAASILAFALISWAVLQSVIGPREQEALPYAELVESQIEDYEMEALLETYSSEVKQEEELDEYDREIIDYLVSENIDLDLIIQEL